MVVYVDGLIRPVPLAPVFAEVESDIPEVNAIDIYDRDTTTEEEEDSLIWSAECRICQEESAIKNLESPCACNGSLKYAHRKCVQHWCNEKGNTICEICHQPYQAGHTSPPPPLQSEETTIDIRPFIPTFVSRHLTGEIEKKYDLLLVWKSDARCGSQMQHEEKADFVDDIKEVLKIGGPRV